MGKKEKREKQKQAKQQRQKIREEAKKREQKKTIFKKVALYGALFVFAVFFVKSISADNPLFVEAENINFGSVSQAEGIKTQEFLIRNDGKETLTIENMDTSCMCTKASIIKGEVKGPEFGMSGHGTNPVWSTTLGPGEEAKIMISYDPNAHKELIGSITRFINIYTDQGTKRLTLKLVQTR